MKTFPKQTPGQTRPYTASKQSLWTRRQFTTTTTAAMVSLASPAAAFAAARDSSPPSGRRRKIALLATEVRKYSHAQHFIDRFLEGYGWQGRHHRPPMELAALYVDQSPEGDLTPDRVRRHRVKLFPTIEEALTLGRSNLAVDGVVLIAEHGLYPRTEKGQTLYPRHQFFQRAVKVFESSGRSVPVFNDKHLSTDWKECVAMVEASKRLGFPFLAGSSLPVTWRIPAVEVPWQAPLVESVCVCYGGMDAYDIHGLETAQCMSERRAGGEAGIRSVHTLRGAKVWETLAERDTTQRLFFAALARSFTGRGNDSYSCVLPDLDWLKKNHRNPLAYFYEHLDGFRTSIFILNGLVVDFNYAGLERGGRIHSCQMYLPMPPAFSTLADFFNPLVHHIEQMILRGAAPYPVERTLLTSGMTLFAIESLYRGGILLPTPELKVAYSAPEQSCFWRA
jgi:hypothetical protein